MVGRVTGEAEIAAWLAERRARGPDLSDWPEDMKPADEGAAYRVQARMMARMAPRWGAQAGWKIGVTTPQMQKYLGIPAPIAGAMPDAFRRAPGAEIRHRDFRRVGIECEMAMVLAAPLHVGASRVEALRAIASVHPAIEIVDDRYGDYQRIGVPAIIADFAFHAGFVLGDAAPDWRGLDLAALRGVTRANGRIMCEGRGADVMSHPLNSLLWLAERFPLEAGAVVMTGSLPLPYWANAGDAIEIEIERLGRVALKIS
jgi:2-keto-4-pentenoate hydratase